MVIYLVLTGGIRRAYGAVTGRWRGQPKCPKEGQTRMKKSTLAQALADAVPANTRRAYDSQMRLFVAWCDEQALASLPATDETLAKWLCARADAGCRMATVGGGMSAVVAAHRKAGQPNPAGEVTAQAMQGLRRRLGVDKHQVAPLDEAAVESVRALADRTPAVSRRNAQDDGAVPRWFRYRQNAALVGVLGEGGLRIGEAAALRWRDVRVEEDGSGRLIVRRSKTDQHGAGATVAVTSRTVMDLEAIAPYPREGETAVFGLSDRSLRRRVKAACRHAGVPNWDRMSGHSGRVGMVQRMVAAGAPTEVVVRQGRWRSSRQVANYARNLQAQEALAYL